MNIVRTRRQITIHITINKFASCKCNIIKSVYIKSASLKNRIDKRSFYKLTFFTKDINIFKWKEFNPAHL